MKLLEENISRTLFDIIAAIFFWIHLLKEIKAKINTCELITLKSFYTAKETTDKTEEQPTE